ncbi:DMT family transporter [Sedimenticola thiotaurini]|uniref:Membrane protein n=1 Tax=Sedimenticola thiotaurini TaxID=1543721 RepID=A0A0F7JYK8_9GAMM|nr:DMT family transporter [Sedimenticola thiotaurini]AKH19733.1 membrane protein [Sedimenticola thiotaurini]
MTRQARAYLFGISAVLLWSTVASAFKLSLRYLEPIQLLFYASVASLLVMFALVIRQGHLPQLLNTSRRDMLLCAVLGLLNPCLYYWVLFKAYDLLPAQEAQPLNYTWAITLSILAVPLLKQQLRRLDLLAIGISYLGILVIATHGAPLELHFSNGYGVLLALGSTLIWSLFWIFNTRSRMEPVVGLFLNFLFAIPIIALITGLTTGFGFDSINGLYGALYVGLFEMGITFVLWLNALRLTTSTAKVANLIFLSPILSLFLIHFIVGEDIHWSSGAGLLLIIAGNGLQQLGKPVLPPVKRE